MSWDDRGYKNRECWFEARDWLIDVGFVEGCNEYERFVMGRDGARTEFLGQTGPHGSWYGGVDWESGNRTLLRGPKKGLRLFKTAKACLEALERGLGTFEVGPPLCAEHAREAIDKR